MNEKDKTMKLEIVSSVNKEDCPYIEDFLNAIESVGKLYYHFKHGDGEEKYPERIFAYEVYHQFRKIMEQPHSSYEGIYLNGEQLKLPEYAEIARKCTPDLILHRNLISTENEDQLFICEIKMNGNNEAMSDLEKFNEMAGLNFQHYIFLYGGVLFKDMYDQIRETDIAKDSDAYNKTICISAYYENGIKQIHCHTLKEIKEDDGALLSE